MEQLWIFSMVLLLLLSLSVVYFLKQLWLLRKCPPGPLPLPLIGISWRTGFRLTPDLLIQLAKRYGNIYTLLAWNLPVIVLSGYKVVKLGLINHSDDFSERVETPFLRALSKGKGIILSNGHTWKQQRRFGLLTMRKLGVGKTGIENQIQDEASQLVEIFADANGQPLDPLLSVTNAFFNVIAVLVFGYRFSLEEENFQKLTKGLIFGTRFVGSFFHVLYEVFPWLMRHIPGPHQKTLSHIKFIYDLAKEEIEKHKENQSLHEPRDFIDYYLLQLKRSKDDPSNTYDEDNLAECIVDFFIAGTETSATSLQWALLFITNHPDVQDEVYKEIQNICSSGLICYQDRKKLPYTNAVIHEIQRIYYVLSFGIARRCRKDMNMLGFYIPKGSIIVPDLRSVLLDPMQWETPDKFNPNHFLDKDGNFVAREEFLPFGAGARTCLGEQISRMEIFLVFTNLLMNFRFQLPRGVKQFREEPLSGLTVHPHSYKVCAIPRHSSL
ncbi:cytochrome P450 2J2-like [Pantherophis guttatus]|uniref:Cytochrome P450 2J2-like n=1 Tax=Pantherophis guttatus TaxID=94885 RepID=A0ABM3YSB9_PANGU|nr:cytochrome P450 2J2-like [Pantherophis guttatus]